MAAGSLLIPGFLASPPLRRFARTDCAEREQLRLNRPPLKVVCDSLTSAAFRRGVNVRNEAIFPTFLVDCEVSGARS